MTVQRSVLGLAVVVAVLPTIASAATKYWKNSVGSGNWSNGNNWSASSAAGVDNGGAPTAVGDVAQMAPTDGVARIITYDVNAPALSAVFLDLSGPGNNRTTFSMTGNTLTAAVVAVGFNGRATFNQSGGLVNQNTGFFDMSVGESAGGVGIYNLSGTGVLTVSRDLFLGHFTGSSGTFNQTGGANTISSNLRIGFDPSTTGAYNISGGTLSVPNIFVGNSGIGTMSISGTGSVSTNNLSINGTSNINLDGGTLRFNSATGLNRINYTAGTVVLPGPRTIGSDTAISALYGASPIIAAGKGLSVETSAVVSTALAITGGTFSTPNLRVGDAGTGSVTVSAGGTVSSTSFAYLGYQAGSTGTATITGTDSSWASPLLRIGENGTGSLNVLAGGNITNSGTVTLGSGTGSSGTATIDGPASTLTSSGVLTVGDSGNGEMSVLNGAHVTNTDGVMAFNNATSASVNVSGAGSTWTNNGELMVGLSGQATMNISEGAKVSNTVGNIGFVATSNSSVNVSGASSEWNNSGALTVGYNGAGALIISSGGSVISGNSSLGDQASPARGTVTVSDHGSSWIVNGSLVAGSAGIGRIFVTNGATAGSTGSTVLGNFAGSVGLIDVSGNGSSWTSADNIVVGVAGSGTLNISSGGIVSTPALLSIGSAGTVNLSGGALRFNGYLKQSAGTINYLAGTVQLLGARNVGADVAIADFFGTSPSIPAAKQLYIEGTANLFVPTTLNGGQFTVGDITNGSLLNFQQGTFRMATADLNVGASGQFGHTIELASGKHVVIDQAAQNDEDGLIAVAAGASFMAQSTNNNGEISLTGTTARLSGGTVSNSGLLRGEGRIDSVVNNLANGEIRVNQGQRLVFTSAPLINAGQTNVVGGTLDLRHGATNSGAINITGGQAEVYGDIGVTTAGRISVGGSTIASLFGEVAQNGVVTVAAGSTAVFFGDVTGNGNFALGGDVEFHSALSPGNSPGVMTFDGNVALQNSAALNIELGGSNAAVQYDQLVVSGTLSLGGALNVSLINGFTPTANQSFNILDWGSLAGTFTSLNLPTVPGFIWNTTQLYTTGVLSLAAAGIPGDYNNNGTVDAADYVIWRKGAAVAPTQGNYSLWRSNFGLSSLGGGSLIDVNAPVPEPATLTILIVAAAGMSIRRRWCA